MNVPADLLELLACPVCREPLEDLHPESRLSCRGCGRRYPVEDGIPALLESSAEPSSDPVNGSEEGT